MFIYQDNPVGSGTGNYNNQKYFKSKENHGSFIPLVGLIKADDFNSNGSTASSTKLQRRNKKLVDEIDLKRRSNSQQERLADYKMRQNLNRTKASPSGCGDGSGSQQGTDDNFSPSILGSLENEVNWTPSSQSSPPRPNRFHLLAPSTERQNDLSLISPKADKRPDPYASEEFIVTAQGGFRPGVLFKLRESTWTV